jgi:quercetin dioxygenase-like cupin family protein
LVAGISVCREKMELGRAHAHTHGTVTVTELVGTVRYHVNDLHYPVFCS